MFFFFEKYNSIFFFKKNRNLTIKPKAFVCQETTIIGDVIIDEGTIVHPKAVIIAENGPIVIGKYNIIEEQAVIKNWYFIFIEKLDFVLKKIFYNS